MTDSFTKALRRTDQIEETLKTAKVDVVETPFLTMMRKAQRANHRKLNDEWINAETSVATETPTWKMMRTAMAMKPKPKPTPMKPSKGKK